MPLRRIGEKIVEGKNEKTQKEKNFEVNARTIYLLRKNI
jgi:hypothetical protein